MLRVMEFPDVIADACLRDSEGRFVFLSVFGRDNAILQFMAAMDLPRDQNGITQFNLVDANSDSHPVDVGGTDRLAKHSGHMPRQNIFGPLSHMWIYDKSLVRPDMANRIAWVLHVQPAAASLAAQVAAGLEDRVWSMVKRMSPVPMLDAWRPAILEWGWDSGALRKLDDPKYPPIGSISGARVSLGGTAFTAKVTELVRAGVLTLPPEHKERKGPKRMPMPST